MYFRAYFLDDHEHVRRFADVEAPDPDAARRELAPGGGGLPVMELWRIDRFLSRFELVGAGPARPAAAPVQASGC